MFCLQVMLHKIFEGPGKCHCLHEGRQGERRDKTIRAGIRRQTGLQQQDQSTDLDQLKLSWNCTVNCLVSCHYILNNCNLFLCISFCYRLAGLAGIVL